MPDDQNTQPDATQAETEHREAGHRRAAATREGRDVKPPTTPDTGLVQR